MSTRLNVLKTYKLFIDGKFPRTESGRYLQAHSPKDGRHLANYCQASRKDLREAVVAARKGTKAWAAASAFLKGQILYRLAEMLEGREVALAQEIADSAGQSVATARQEVAAAVDRLVYYAGWTDKVAQVMGSVNPVASPHFNFTILEPMGVVGLLAPDRPTLLGAVTLLGAALVGGNAVILITSDALPLPVVSFAEVVATSDVPAGVVNILSGQRAELAKTLAEHMDVNAVVDACGDAKVRHELELGVAANLKRLVKCDFAEKDWWDGAKSESPYHILGTLEAKTAWHPMGV